MKKMKLLMSLSMLCLSIAMLCFGVFAASSVTYTISGTISYDVKDVFCTISGKVYKKSDSNVAVATLNTNLTTLIGETETGYETAQTLNGKTSTGESGTTETLSETVNIVFGRDSSDANKEWYTYYIVLTIQNNSTKTLNASLEITNPASSDTGYSLLNISTGSKTANISANGSAKVGVAYSLNSKLTSISGLQLKNVLTVS